MPQLEYWMKLAVYKMNREQASFTSLASLAVAGAMSQEGNQKLRQVLKSMEQNG